MSKDDPLDPNPFANAMNAPRGNSDASEIYTAVGFALDRWEHCEENFAFLYANIVSPPGRGAMALRSFGALVASATRRDVLMHAIDALFQRPKDNPELHTTIRHLLNLYKDASARRNEIAHAIVMGEVRAKIVNKVAVPLPTEWFLVPPFTSSRKRVKLVAKYRLSSVEIHHLRGCFEVLGERAREASKAVRDLHP